MHVKNWNRLQSAADFGCILSMGCMLHIISLSALISQNVKYWFEICDDLVPIFHAFRRIGTNFYNVILRNVKFAVHSGSNQGVKTFVFYIVSFLCHFPCQFKKCISMQHLIQIYHVV